MWWPRRLPPIGSPRWGYGSVARDRDAASILGVIKGVVRVDAGKNEDVNRILFSPIRIRDAHGRRCYRRSHGFAAER